MEKIVLYTMLFSVIFFAFAILYSYKGKLINNIKLFIKKDGVNILLITLLLIITLLFGKKVSCDLIQYYKQSGLIYISKLTCVLLYIIIIKSIVIYMFSNFKTDKRYISLLVGLSVLIFLIIGTVLIGSTFYGFSPLILLLLIVLMRKYYNRFNGLYMTVIFTNIISYFFTNYFVNVSNYYGMYSIISLTILQILIISVSDLFTLNLVLGRNFSKHIKLSIFMNLIIFLMLPLLAEIMKYVVSRC